jgi:predicted permease
VAWLHDLPALAGALAPVFLLLALGLGLGRAGLITAAGNDSLDRLLYWVALPAQLVWMLGRQDLSGFDGRCLAAAAAAFVLGLAVAWWAARGLPGPRRAVAVNGAARANGAFVGLPVVALVAEAFPAEGPALGRAYALVFAGMVPLFNAGSVLVFRLAQRDGRFGVRDWLGVAADIPRNPIVLASCAGIALALLAPGALARPGPWLAPLASALGLLAAAAIPLALVATGSRIDPTALRGSGALLAWTTAAKLVFVPALTLACGLALGLPPPALAAATILMACPVAVGTVPMARQLGGDVPLMATVISLTTVLSPVTLFCWLALLRALPR